jgi:hypothetical protein
MRGENTVAFPFRHRRGFILRLTEQMAARGPVAAQKNVYCDHEAGQGGGVLDLIVRQKGDDHRDAVECLDANGTRITPDAGRNWQGPRCGGAYG